MGTHLSFNVQNLSFHYIFPYYHFIKESNDIVFLTKQSFSWKNDRWKNTLHTWDEREGKRPLICWFTAPNGYNHRGWVVLTPGTRNFTWVFYESIRDPGIGIWPTVFISRSTIKNSEYKWICQISNWHSDRQCECSKHWLNLLYHGICPTEAKLIYWLPMHLNPVSSFCLQPQDKGNST